LLWQKTEQIYNASPGNGPGVNSGKLKLWAQAKAGLKLAEYDSQFCTSGNGWGASRNSVGLLTDSNGGYWWTTVYYDDSNPRVAFRKLKIPSVLRKIRDSFAEGSLDYLWAEAYCLGHSTIDPTSEIYEAPLGSDKPLSNAYPISYGWNFNWDGDEAVIVVHEADGTLQGTFFPTSSIVTKVAKLSLSVSESSTDVSVSARISIIETAKWEATPPDDVFFRPANLPLV